MTEVREHLDVFPFATKARVLRRLESNLLTRALPGPMGPLWSNVERIDVVHFDQAFAKGPFAAPRFLYEGLHGRIEWQQMDFRQPFYHRNLDVDEMSYQIAGDRTLMTEYGSAELRQGDLVRIPAGVAHDSWGRQESHILWYLPEPCSDRLPPQRMTQALIPPFDGWQAATVNELITDCMGSAGGHDTAAQRSDEQLILEDALSHDDRLAIMRSSAQPSTDGRLPDTQWIWTSALTNIGVVNTGISPGLDYVRHRNADEIQYQMTGHRVLVTQLGVLEIVPGDFVRIPIGVAFTSISAEPNEYIATVSYARLPRVYDATRQSEMWSADDVEVRRSAVLQSTR